MTGGDIRQELGKRILILDGAMGTMLQRRGLSGNNEEFNFTRPEVIGSIHRAYIEAGADIIETNSFSANRISQAEYGCGDRAYDMAREAARIARSAADSAGRTVWVAGSAGPSSKSLSLAQDLSDPAFRAVSFDDMAEAYGEQFRGLIDGGADLILLETCFDALNTKAAIYALETIFAQDPSLRRPVMISASASDRSGRTLTGQTIEAFYRSVCHARPLSFGLNCSLGAEELAPLIRDVASWAECAVSLHPNAGLPNELGSYDQSPEAMAGALAALASEGVLNIAGGCCGTTPEHIAAIAEALAGAPFRPAAKKTECLYVSGLESVCIDRKMNFTNVGERTNVAGSRKFARLIASGDYEKALGVAASQIEGGAPVIDISMDDAMLDPAAEMEKFLRYVANDPAVAKAAIMVDSSDWAAILAGLKNAQGRCIVNSISLKEGEETFLRKAAELRRLGAAVVVMAFDEQGQATDYGRKIQICGRAYRLLREKAGFAPEEIILDPGVLAVGTGIREHSHYGTDFIRAVKWIKENLPGALTSGGISNLSFAFRGNNPVREAMHSVFLYHAIGAGLDMGIVNPGMLQVYDDIEPGLRKCVSDVILDTDAQATERLLAKAAQIQSLAREAESGAAGSPADGSAEAAGGDAEDTGTAADRLRKALVRGSSPTLVEDVMECLKDLGGRAVDVIEGPLMSGMEKVGQLFGEGKMFLPQVVKSAKTMRDAVTVLEPYMKGDPSVSGTRRRPLILLATVKGDVHDIGKNIVGIVMGCNGFEVCDLGVMVPVEQILDRAAETGADIIGVSGLITPSLHQMEQLCREMAARGLSTPLLVGGATTSALHTAVKLAPLYDHVFYGADASASAVLAGRLMSSRKECEDEQHAAQDRLRALYAESRAGRTAAAAAAPREPFPAESFLHGKVFDDICGRELKIKDVLPYFDWKLFYVSLGVKDSSDEAAARLNGDTIRAIDRLMNDGLCRITVCARFDACVSRGDDIVCDSYTLPMLRQEDGDRLSLSDFAAPERYGFASPVGMFAVSVRLDEDAGSGDSHRSTGGKSLDYDSLLERSIMVTLAEAAASWIDTELRHRLPEGPAFRIVRPAAGYASCPDHSLKKDILALLPGADRLGISLTESYAMIPDSSICGLIFVHPEACYPEIRGISRKTAEDYARRRGMSDSEMQKLLGNLL